MHLLVLVSLAAARSFRDKRFTTTIPFSAGDSELLLLSSPLSSALLSPFFFALSPPLASPLILALFPLALAAAGDSELLLLLSAPLSSMPWTSRTPPSPFSLAIKFGALVLILLLLLLLSVPCRERREELDVGELLLAVTVGGVGNTAGWSVARVSGNDFWSDAGSSWASTYGRMFTTLGGGGCWS
jgi:hypothetical protein